MRRMPRVTILSSLIMVGRGRLWIWGAYTPTELKRVLKARVAFWRMVEVCIRVLAHAWSFAASLVWELARLARLQYMPRTWWAVGGVVGWIRLG